MQLAIARVGDLPLLALAALAREAEREGFDIVARLDAEWRSGSNRFAQPGEALWLARHGSQLVATCGLNRDPYTDAPRTGRLRRVYVSAAWRRHGLGRLLVRIALHEARAHFATLRLHTDTAHAARFYEQQGFARVAEPETTHALALARGGS